MEPLARIFIAADATGGHAEHQVELAAATLEDQLQAFAEEMHGHRGELVAEQIAHAVPEAGAVELIDASRTELLGGSVRWSASGARLSIRRPRSSPTCVWVTSDVDWVYPYEPALWRHLVYCVERQQRPMIVARKIAFSTFPLLKRLGCIGLQLHHLYVPQMPTSTLARRAFTAGPPLRDVSSASAHVVIEEYMPQHLSTEYEEDESVSEAIRIAQEYRLDDDGNADSIAALREWANCSPIPLPAPWKAQVTKFLNWTKMD